MRAVLCPSKTDVFEASLSFLRPVLGLRLGLRLRHKKLLHEAVEIHMMPTSVSQLGSTVLEKGLDSEDRLGISFLFLEKIHLGVPKMTHQSVYLPERA
jgi:hypothetical protein